MVRLKVEISNHKAIFLKSLLIDKCSYLQTIELKVDPERSQVKLL